MCVLTHLEVPAFHPMTFDHRDGWMDKLMINRCSFISWNFKGTQPHPALGEKTERRGTSKEKKPDTPVSFSDPIVLPEKTLMLLV